MSLALSSVHSPALLRGRAEDVPSVQLFRFIPLHVASWPHHGWSHTGLRLPSARSQSSHRQVMTVSENVLLTKVHMCFLNSSKYTVSSTCTRKKQLLPNSLISPSFPLSRASCGPFGNGETVFNVTGVCVASLPGPAQTTLRYLASEAFALPLILAEV